MNFAAAGLPPVSNLSQPTVAASAVALSRLAYPGGLEVRSSSTQTPVTKAVVVNEGDAAAALAGSVLARHAWGPVLQSPAGGLSADARSEVSRLQAVGAYVIGGAAQLSATVDADLAAAGGAAGRHPADRRT